MADKVGMILCLFIVICWIPTSPTASEAVPDGLVYTEVKKTLVQGFQGVLTCRFYRDPIAVYWKKGPDPDNRDLMVVWHNGKVSGPRFEDGSYDIDDGYSLIIKNVSAEDTGRMYCIVSNYNGILIENYTDIAVTDTPVTTIQNAILQMREATFGILQCIVHIKAERVSWKRVTTSSANDSLVVIANSKDDAEVNGTNYDLNTYNMTQDNSLVIRDVQVHHGGLYVCEATDFDTGISFRNETFLSVVAQPLAPFPTIQGCVYTGKYGSTNEYCTLVAKSEMTLTCEANGYYPALHLYFLYGSRQVEPLETREIDNTDGTRNKTVTIAAVGSKELYTCAASIIPGGSEDESTTVLLHDERKSKPTAVIITMILLAFLTFCAICFFIWRKRTKRTSTRYSSVSQEMKSVKDLTDEELQILDQRVGEVMLKHYERIYGAVEIKTFEDDKIIREITSSLFDSDIMLSYWQQRKTSTLSQYGMVVRQGLTAGNMSGHAWPSDEELRSISRHLNEESLKKIGKKLQLEIDSKPDDVKDDNKIVECLLKWRNKIAHKTFVEKHEQLSSAFGSVKLKGLIPVLRGNFMYKAELVETAFQLVIQDLLPVAEALEIPFTRLVSYRPAFHPSNLEIGTIDLLSKLMFRIKEDTSNKEQDSLKMHGDRRDIFCKKLGDFQYRNVATLGMCVYEMSYGELFRIANALERSTEDESDRVKACSGGDFQRNKVTPAPGNDQGEEIGSANHGTLLTPSQLENVEDIQTEQIVITGSLSGIPNKEPIMNKSRDSLSEESITLQRILKVTVEDMVDIESSSRPTTLSLLKIWKEKPREVVFNYRAALAYELLQNKMSRLADQVLAGEYIKEETSHEFILNIVESLTRDQLMILGNLLKLSKGNWHKETPLDDITKQICDWVADWTKKMKGNSKSVFKCLKKLQDDVIDITRFTTVSKKHRDLNDRLLDSGFLALAREVMIIEQQLAWM
ncbi:uncharacterized protein LOC129271928 isoform X1 [Lytechinus pictus]|uniref:uncharacterized protein LOC129271928 isoform X1 n=1 Tax=Lytechinus pictus TaxID=7653 RepID=UPI0030BA0532